MDEPISLRCFQCLSFIQEHLLFQSMKVAEPKWLPSEKQKKGKQNENILIVFAVAMIKQSTNSEDPHQMTDTRWSME
jgi:hypothetical protein